MNFKQLPDEFYPTPPELAAKMVNCKYLKSEIKTILEPFVMEAACIGQQKSGAGGGRRA